MGLLLLTRTVNDCLKLSKKLRKCILQTPLMFTPFGIQETKNNKKVIDISFQNINNDKSYKYFKNL